MGGPASQRRGWLRGADTAWVFALVLYVLAGVALVPFHGDESTLIMMSRDYHDRFLAGDLSSLLYHDPPVDAARQHLRLLNGTVPPYLIGLAWHLAGYTVDDLNDQWLWGAGWAWNVANGHMPSPDLLLVARWPSALLTALSVPLLFGLGMRWGGRSVAYPASFILATHPVVLLQGRRAYMEGALLCFSLLVVLLAAWWGQRLTRTECRGWRDRAAPLALGVAAGLAAASKHSGAIPVVGSFLGLLVLTVWRVPGRRGAAAGGLALSGLLAAVTFLILNPAWWGDPLRRLLEVLALRQGLVADQMAAFPEAAYPDLLARLGGLLAQLSVAPPAYYEVSAWADYIAGPIQTYQASPWTGIQYGVNALTALLGFGLLLLSLIGVGRLVRSLRDGQAAALIVGCSGGLALLVTLAAIPLAWQRYVMPLYPFEALLAGGGLAWLGRRALRARRRPAPARGAPPGG